MYLFKKKSEPMGTMKTQFTLVTLILLSVSTAIFSILLADFSLPVSLIGKSTGFMSSFHHVYNNNGLSSF